MLYIYIIIFIRICLSLDLFDVRAFLWKESRVTIGRLKLLNQVSFSDRLRYSTATGYWFLSFGHLICWRKWGSCDGIALFCRGARTGHPVESNIIHWDSDDRFIGCDDASPILSPFPRIPIAWHSHSQPFLHSIDVNDESVFLQKIEWVKTACDCIQSYARADGEKMSQCGNRKYIWFDKFIAKFQLTHQNKGFYWVFFSLCNRNIPPSADITERKKRPAKKRE